MSRPLLALGEDELEVRVLEVQDAEELFAVVDRERERLRQWFPWPDQTRTPADVCAFIERNRASDTAEALGIYVHGICAGGIGLSVDAMHQDGEIGFWIDSTHEGRGFVTRACRGLISYGFATLGLHRVTLRAAPDNVRSRPVAERLGFTKEGLNRDAGRSARGYFDLVVYGLLANEVSW